MASQPRRRGHGGTAGLVTAGAVALAARILIVISRGR